MRRHSFILGSAAALASAPLLERLAARAAAVQSLKTVAASKGIVFGSNVRDVDLLTADPAFASLTADQCAVVEGGHSFQWAQLRPSPTTFNFAKADELASWAQDHSMKLCECHLMWHHSFPKWLPGYLNSSNWRDLLSNHIKTVCSRYAGKMYYWVVVNEAVQLKDGRPDGLRNKLWTAVGGQDAIDLAFTTAGAADPKAQLVYNDYGLEQDDPNNIEKRKVVLKMVQGMKSRGVPIHAVGLESHLNGGQDFQGAGLGQFIDDLGSMGVKTFVTELDTGDEQLPSDAAARDATMATLYKKFLETILPHKSVTTIVLWSLSDKYFWRNGWTDNAKGKRSDGLPQRGMPFGTSLEPTAIYNAMLEAFQAAPTR
jgi:endo-1,4-beta-xylanase